MNRLRHLPKRQIATAAAALVLLISLAVAGVAVSSGGPKPPPKPLDVAIRDAIAAPPVEGITARLRFTNELVPGTVASATGVPVLAGAEGRVWLAADGRLRLELQSELGDAQVVLEEERLSVYDGFSNTIYRTRVERHEGPGGAADGRAPAPAPALADIRRALGHLSRDADLSGAIPSTVAGQPAYTLRVSPRHDDGLIGAAELAWDAVRGVPLRAALYAEGREKPVLELTATDVDYGAISAGDLSASFPTGARVVELDRAARAGARPERRDAHRERRSHRMAGGGREVEGLARVRDALPFELRAPRELVGLPRKSVRMVEIDGRRSALVVYGQGLGALAVLQQEAGAGKLDRAFGSLPRVSIDGATGTELATALGTALRFEDGGVSYTLVGSLPPAAAEAAARELR